MRNLKMVALAFAVVFSLITLRCQKQSESSTKNDNGVLSASIKSDTLPLISDGLQLLESNCFPCHSPDASHNNRAAPPMIAMKRRYMQMYDSRDAFTERWVSFVQHPSEEKALMSGAVRRFGLMPVLNFSKEELQTMAHFVYDNDLEKPLWFEEHYQKRHGNQQGSTSTEADYLQKGKQLAMATKAVLGSNLLKQIQENGPENAVKFCQIKALPLTDSMAMAFQSNIKRVSDKPRNQGNRANENELSYITNVKEQLKTTQSVKPMIQEIEGNMVGYYPIITNAMCLNCHGNTQNDINSATLTNIQNLYPHDLATGYGENELRGIWVVTMKKE